MTQPILTSPEELETWLDELIAEKMNQLHIPGVTFSLVQNGEIFLAKGYGYGDLEQQIPVVADSTVFCVGGNAKLFTATAIMQLVEKGSLNLDDDVNQYLPNFQIENNYPQPLTIANLLTHTTGFDNSFIGMMALSASDIIPLGEHLAAKMPKLVRAPGEVIVGCNYSYGFLGYIVELVAGIPFSQYIKENILQPLEMNHSGFELPSDLALSYRYKEKQQTYQTLPFDYLQILALYLLRLQTYGVPKIITLLLSILLVTSVLSLGLPFCAVWVWMNQDSSLIEQLHYSLVTLSTLGLIPFLNYWNLLGFRY